MPNNTENMGLFPGSGRFSGDENGTSVQYSWLENPMDRRAWTIVRLFVSDRVRHNLATKQQHNLKKKKKEKTHGGYIF